MTLDPLVDQVRDARRRISERFGHDPKRLVEHYMELQKRHGDRLVHSLEGRALDATKTEALPDSE